jgi:hypothetical protein
VPRRLVVFCLLRKGLRGNQSGTLAMLASALALTRPIRRQQCCAADHQRKVGRYFLLKISAGSRRAICRKACSRIVDRQRVVQRRNHLVGARSRLLHFADKEIPAGEKNSTRAAGAVPLAKQSLKQSL